MKQFAYANDVALLHNLTSAARAVIRNAASSPHMQAALAKFLAKAEEALLSIKREAVRVAINKLIRVVTKSAHKATHSRWSPDPIRGWMPDPRDEFAKTEFEVDGSCERLMDSANEHLNPQRNDDNEHMFRKQWKWQDHNGYY
ncbi:MAG TPA: hypothetical protein VHU91_02650 [Mycobacteriales bacterium]|nr:hypothetical protein [Mycobacteriales bacterium]